MNSILNSLLIKTQRFLGPHSSSVTSARHQSSKLDSKSHRVDNLEKRFLVWTGKYKSVAEVPTFVEQNVVERARNRMRIRIANYMMAATALACVVMVYFGKQAAQRGDSVAKQNLEWHRQVNEEAKK
ncbi:hypothetical protein Zmor_000488 [Zophobas morio]|uniref:Uncharacterized protein n=1 Tax=Zophobas morio TaxID=2755281 RepID=A0AA38IZ91_9CUCU|nr:hypothetical protein Zmor_000488 [Zophobas morio]